MPARTSKCINALVLFASLTVNGCTHTLDVPPVHFTDYKIHEQIESHLALLLSEDLRNAKLERIQGFDTIIIPLGGHLAINAESLTRAIFTEVTVLRENIAPLDSQIGAILTPRLITSALVSPTSSFIKQILKIVAVFEWELKDRDNNLIWIDMITAEGRLTEPGGSAEENRTKLMESLVRDLFGKSYDAFISSPELRQLRATRSS